MRPNIYSQAAFINQTAAISGHYVEYNHRFFSSKIDHTFSFSLNNQHLFDYLISLLDNLEYIEQSPKYHPEGNALYHSLQVFQIAYRESDDPELWAAALFHDVGKAIDYPAHAEVGAEQLEGILSTRIVWLIRHHLDLLTSPKKTRKRLRGTKQLSDLELLRRWDLAGRKIDVEVICQQEAVNIVLSALDTNTK